MIKTIAEFAEPAVNEAVLHCNNKFKNRAGERGSASLVAMIIIGVACLTIFTLMSYQSRRETRNLDKNREKLHEKWEARSAANVMAQNIRIGAYRQFDRDVSSARTKCDVPHDLVLFDKPDTAREKSSPAVIFNSSGELECAETGFAVERIQFIPNQNMSASGLTSVFGSFDNWARARQPLLEKQAFERFSDFGLHRETARIVQLEEIYRRSLGDDINTAYAVRYIVEGKFGYYPTRVNGEIVLGSNLPSCATTVSLEANPPVIMRGDTVTLRAAYAGANRLRFFNQSGTLLHEKIVVEQLSPANYDYSFTPAITDSYYVIATGSGGCQAQSSVRSVEVQEICTVSPPQITNFNSSATEVSAGELFTLTWQTSGGIERVRLNGADVSVSGSQTLSITADTTFTLAATDSDPVNDCPIERQIIVRIRQAPPCPLSAPQIQSFSADPSSIQPNQTSNLQWSIAGLAAGGTVRIEGPNGFASAGLNAAGNQSVTPPAAEDDYIYTIIAENACPDGTKLESRRTAVIRVRACPPPNIDFFAVNPATVTQGNNALIHFAWSISGNPSLVSINNGVGGGLPASGTVEVTQPQTTTTYTVTATGCGVTRTAAVTVNVVISCPPPVINSFTVTPDAVISGDNAQIVFSWDVTETAGKPLHLQIVKTATGEVLHTDSNKTGSWSILQPQIDSEYRLEAVTECGSSPARTTAVTVSGSSSCVNAPYTGQVMVNGSYTGGILNYYNYDPTRLDVDPQSGQIVPNPNPSGPSEFHFTDNWDAATNVHNFTMEIVHQGTAYCGGTNNNVIVGDAYDGLLSSVEIRDVDNNVVFSRVFVFGDNTRSFVSNRPIGNVSYSADFTHTTATSDNSSCFVTQDTFNGGNGFCRITP